MSTFVTRSEPATLWNCWHCFGCTRPDPTVLDRMDYAVDRVQKAANFAVMSATDYGVYYVECTLQEISDIASGNVPNVLYRHAVNVGTEAVLTYFIPGLGYVPYPITAKTIAIAKAFLKKRA